MKVELADGVYQVMTDWFVAGFVVRDGAVTQCAPILRKKLSHWVTVARRIR